MIVWKGAHGDDTFYGGSGADTISGGIGHDVVGYNTSSSGVNVDLSDGSAETGGDAQGDVILDIDQVDGSLFGDTLVAGASGITFYGDHRWNRQRHRERRSWGGSHRWRAWK